MFVLSVFVFDASQAAQRSATMCQCECQNRVTLDPSLHNCMTIFSKKSKGYITADEHYVFEPNEKRYVFATNKNKKWETAKWFVYTKDSFNQSYALRNKYVNEWLFAGSDLAARDAYRRYVFTWVKEKEIVPYEGYWQFIPDPNKLRDGYRIRNAWSGEYMFVDDETHSPRYDYNRVYLWRHVGQFQSTDDRHWFTVAKC